MHQGLQYDLKFNFFLENKYTQKKNIKSMTVVPELQSWVCNLPIFTRKCHTAASMLSRLDISQNKYLMDIWSKQTLSRRNTIANPWWSFILNMLMQVSYITCPNLLSSVKAFFMLNYQVILIPTRLTYK
jgi:hypothetical protein